MPEDMLLALERFVTREKSERWPKISMLELHAFKFNVTAATQNNRQRIDRIYAAIQQKLNSDRNV
jgi:hypothetical protein